MPQKQPPDTYEIAKNMNTKETAFIVVCANAIDKYVWKLFFSHSLFIQNHSKNKFTKNTFPENKFSKNNLFVFKLDKQYLQLLLCLHFTEFWFHRIFLLSLRFLYFLSVANNNKNSCRFLLNLISMFYLALFFFFFDYIFINNSVQKTHKPKEYW